MNQDGARLIKFKEVFKRAIQEILKEEDNLNSIFNSPAFKDSFYSESTFNLAQEDIKQMFIDIKNKFTEHFKTKIRQTNLDFKLNSLDRDIKDNRSSYKDIKSPDYIKEILESNIVDKKEELMGLLEQETVETENKIDELKLRKTNLEELLDAIKRENYEYEIEYQKLVSKIEEALDQ